MRRRRMSSSCSGDGCKCDGGDGLSLTDVRNWACMQLHHSNARGEKAKEDWGTGMEDYHHLRFGFI